MTKNQDNDIFRNKFLEIDKKMITRQLIEALKTRKKFNHILVSRHRFMIISENEKSEKRIVFEIGSNEDEFLNEENIFKYLKWNQCCVWDFGGNIEIVIRKDDTQFIDIIISSRDEHGCVLNILISLPFIKEIITKTQKLLDRIAGDGLPEFVEVKLVQLDTYAFREIKKPTLVWKRQQS